MKVHNTKTPDLWYSRLNTFVIAYSLIDIGLPEQAVGGFPLGSGLVVEDRPSELS